MHIFTQTDNLIQTRVSYAVCKYLYDFHEMKMSLTIVEIWFSFSAGFSCHEVYILTHSSIIKMLHSSKRFTCRSNYGDLKYFALVEMSWCLCSKFIPTLTQPYEY